uniref:WPP domain-containing protein n=1 Tax=Chlamydomonas leiostraca TaxID=1034604 RepID=A0A7S0R6D9_9CHLO
MIKNNGKFEADSVQTGSSGEVDLTGSRDFLTTETTERVLAALLAPGSTIKRIKFSTKSFGRDAAAVAAKALKNVSATLTDADISDVIAGRPEDEALDALRAISAALVPARLARLNLSDNALGEKGVRACADVLTSQPALESLSLQNVGCSINACRAVAELVTKSQDLRQLHLFNNMSDNEGAGYMASILARAPRMEDFRMASSRVGPQGGMALCQALCTGRSLVRLDVSDNPMTEEVAPALAALIRAQPGLKALNLNDTSLTNDGAVVVALALAEGAPALEELGLALNEITAAGAKAVAVAVAGKAHLARLNLRENELEDRGAVIIARAVEKVATLRTLDLCGNQIKRVGAVAAAKAAASRPHLELLALDENMVSEAGLDEVRAVMAGAGKAGALGPLDDNMEEDDEELEEEDDEDDSGLSALMAKAGLA